MFKGKMRPLQDDNHPDWQLYNANPVQLEAMRDLVRKYDRARGFYFFPRERWEEVCTYFLGALSSDRPPRARSRPALGPRNGTKSGKASTVSARRSDATATPRCGAAGTPTWS